MTPLEQLRDWARLNEALGDQARTLAWWDKVKDSTDDPEISMRAAGMEIALKDILVEELRWSELAKVYPEPKQWLERRSEVLEHMLEAYSQDTGLEPLPAAMRAETKRRRLQDTHDSFREDVAIVYASMLAAGRDAEADEMAELASEKDGLPAAMRLALVDMAIGAGVPREEHLRWVDEAEQNPDLADKARQLRQWLRGSLKP